MRLAHTQAWDARQSAQCRQGDGSKDSDSSSDRGNDNSSSRGAYLYLRGRTSVPKKRPGIVSIATASCSAERRARWCWLIALLAALRRAVNT